MQHFSQIVPRVCTSVLFIIIIIVLTCIHVYLSSVRDTTMAEGQDGGEMMKEARRFVMISCVNHF